MSVLPHEHLDVSDDREAVLFVDQRVGRPLEDDVGDQPGLLVGARVLSDGHGNCKVIVRQVRAHSLVTEDHIEAHDCVLRVLRALEKHVDIDMLDEVQFFL